MRNAATILSIIRERGKRGLPLERVYRLLFNPELFLMAYGKIGKNAGALTPGVTTETADGMTLDKIERIIGLLREERYRFRPVRRSYIEKRRNPRQKRPLGIPTWSDKLVQEVVRLILEAYYEPRFSARSHGFRPGRGCHTALREIHQTWKETVWFIEGDIKGCFDNLDHGVLLGILREDIHDGRFLRLIAGMLKAGYLEDWRYHQTLSGSPQGGVVSPILANVYLDRLDQFVAHALLPAYTRGQKRQENPAYNRVRGRLYCARKRGRRQEAADLHRQMTMLPAQDTHDPQYRRLHYVRYADDFLLGFAGPQVEAEDIKRQLRDFLRDSLKLDLSAEKTLITHGRTRAARFLGYDIVVLHSDHKRTRGTNGVQIRAINGVVGLKVPMDVVREKCAAYMKRGKPIHRTVRLNDDVLSIISAYDSEFRGVADYYQLAYNRHRLDRLKWVMEVSLTKTLAAKLKISVRQVYRRYGTTIQTDAGPRRAIQAVKAREGRNPLMATWGGVSLAWNPAAVLNEAPPKVWSDLRADHVRRLLADTCELCGSRTDVQVHHIKALRSLQKAGRRPKPDWKQVMIARQRKTLAVCKACHAAIHAGRPTRADTHTGDRRAG